MEDTTKESSRKVTATPDLAEVETLRRKSTSVDGKPEPPKAKASKKLWVTLLIALILVMGIGVLITKGGKAILMVGRAADHVQQEAWALQRFTVPKARSIKLDAFLIPFMKNRKFTYASLNISFTLHNEEIWAEMINKKTWLRGIIFDRLQEEINRSEEIPSLGEVKAFILEEVNRILTSGRIGEAYVTDFLII